MRPHRSKKIRCVAQFMLLFMSIQSYEATRNRWDKAPTTVLLYLIQASRHLGGFLISETAVDLANLE